MVDLVPRKIGVEMVELSPAGAKAMSGTGFDPDNPQHYLGSDAVRYAIALQQLRDARDFPALDAAKAKVSKGYFVMQEHDGTRLLPKPPLWDVLPKSRQKAEKRHLSAGIVNGILYDANPADRAWRNAPEALAKALRIMGIDPEKVMQEMEKGNE